MKKSKKLEKSNRPNAAKEAEKIALSPGELEILEVLWTDGPRTIKETVDGLAERGRRLGYSTVNTRLERMIKKGLLKREQKFGGRYSPNCERSQVVNRFFDPLQNLTNFAPLILGLASKRELRDEEIAAMRQLLNELSDEVN